jgi:hypothetical protein
MSKLKFTYKPKKDEVANLKHFIFFCKKNLKLDDLPKEFIFHHERGDHQMTTGCHEIHNNKDIIVRTITGNRHFIDIIRTIAHELVHYKQYSLGKIKKHVQDIGGPIEDEANALAGRLVKKYLYKNQDIIK